MNIQAIIDDIDGRFRSGNDVPVSRATLTAEAWAEVREALLLAAKFQRLNDGRFEMAENEYIKTHLLVGVNSWRGENWIGFDEVTVEEFDQVMQTIEEEKENVRITS